MPKRSHSFLAWELPLNSLAEKKFRKRVSEYLLKRVKSTGYEANNRNELEAILSELHAPPSGNGDG